MCAEKKTLECPNKRKQKSKEYLKYQRYIRSKEFKEIKELVKKKYNEHCAVCGAGEEDGRTLACHHKTYEHLYNEKEHLGDLILLCNVCHKAIHSSPSNFKRFKNKNPEKE